MGIFPLPCLTTNRYFSICFIAHPTWSKLVEGSDVPLANVDKIMDDILKDQLLCVFGSLIIMQH